MQKYRQNLYYPNIFLIIFLILSFFNKYKKMESKERLQKIIDNEGLNAKTFSEKLGFERPQIIYDILKNKTKTISDNLSSKIYIDFDLKKVDEANRKVIDYVFFPYQDRDKIKH